MGERETLANRITAYLHGGGLFNPEAAKHDAVRDLLIDCRAALAPAPAEAVAWKDALAVIQRHIEQLEGKERTAQFLAVTVSLEKNASRTIGELHETMRSTVDTLKHVPTHPAPARGEAVREDERLLVEANDMLRSMHAVIEREMKRTEGPMITNWNGFSVQVARWLRESHQRTNTIRAALARPDRERAE